MIIFKYLNIIVNSSISKYLILTFFGLITTFGLKAQGQITGYFDAGSVNTSEGLFIRTGVLGGYTYRKTTLSAGCLFDLKSPSAKFFTGSVLNLTQEFSIKKFPLEVQGLFMYNPFSNLVHEINWGLLVNIKRNHFAFRLGTSFRTYSLSKSAEEEYDLEDHEKVHENWNLVYFLQYQLKPEDHHWNIGIALTDIDHFMIRQETNPMVYLNGKYKLQEQLTLYAEAWYFSAGNFNLAANYFGFFFRTGLLWNID